MLVIYLRPSKIDGARHAWAILALLVERLRQVWPQVRDLSSDLSLVIEIVDEEDKIANFQIVLSEIFEQAGCGGLVTLENVRVVHYPPEKKT